MNSTIIFLSITLVLMTIMLKFNIVLKVDYNTSSIQIVIYLFRLKILTINLYLYGLYYRINSSKKIDYPVKSEEVVEFLGNGVYVQTIEILNGVTQ